MKTNLLKTTLPAILVVILFLSSSLIQAQHKEKGPRQLPDQEKIEKMVDELSTELSLTKKQEKQVSDIYESHFEEVGKTMEKNKEVRETSKKEMKELRTSFENDVKAVLSEDQQKQFDVFMKEKEAQRGQNKKPRR